MKKLKLLILIVTILIVGFIKIDISSQEKLQTNSFENTNISNNESKENTQTVIILNNKNIIDAILSKPLAKAYDAPIFFTEKDGISNEIKNELEKLNPINIIVVGGEDDVPKKVIRSIEKILPKVSIDRLNGADKYETSLIIGKKIDEIVNVEEVFIVNANSNADLLSISSKAGADKKPIILTDKNYIPDNIYSWLKEERLNNAYFIGGDNVISDKIINNINIITSKDVKSNRVFGKNSIETNTKIIEKFYPDSVLESILVVGINDYTKESNELQLALKNQYPIIIVNDKLSDSQISLLKSKYTDKIYRIGDTINESIFDKIIKLIKNKEVLFFIPHQDDEVLSFSSTIRKYINKGYKPHVILATDGSRDEGVRARLNGVAGKVCRVHNYAHIPKKENYNYNNRKLDYITYELLTKYRNDEYVNALLALGVKKENIHIPSEVATDGSLSKEYSVGLIRKYINKYKNATVHTFYNEKFSRGNHNDHMNLGKGATELFNKGEVDNLYLHVEPYLYKDFVNNNLDEDIIIDKPASTKDRDIILNSMKEYNIWNPQDGKLAVGYHSVNQHFDKAMKETTNYRLKYMYKSM